MFGISLGSNASAEEVVSPTAAENVPACTSGLRLRVVQFDPNRPERSFVVFAGSSLRAPPLRKGSRVGAFQIERIERGSAVLGSQSQRCSVRLRNEPSEHDHELRAISVDAVRSGLRARPAIAASNVPDRARLLTVARR